MSLWHNMLQGSQRVRVLQLEWVLQLGEYGRSCAFFLRKCKEPCLEKISSLLKPPSWWKDKEYNSTNDGVIERENKKCLKFQPN